MPDTHAADVARWRTARGELRLAGTGIMGILNATPDSFYDGGRHAQLAAAVAHANCLIEAGAHILDIGGESTRPGARAVDAREERQRVVPVVKAIVAEWPDLPVSVDTTKAEVAEAALDAGAAIINDVSALRLDARMAGVVAGRGAGIVLMHSRGDVSSMAGYGLAEYDGDVVSAVVSELHQAVGRARDAGIEASQIVLDPGLGFAKRTEHSVALLARLDALLALGFPVLVGASRKRFVGELAGGLEPAERLEGTIAACVTAALAGAQLVRVHDVAPVRRALAVANAVREARS